MNCQVVLKPREEKRLLQGHQWIFSNEINEARGNPQAGDIVEILRSDGRSLGIGFYNPHSLIAVRFLSERIEPIDFGFVERRIRAALRFRRRIYPNCEWFRLVHSESDFLPGLIIDRFNHLFSIQTLSYGMDRLKPLICDVIESHFRPGCIVERNESNLRSLEGLPPSTNVLRGSVQTTVLSDGDLKYRVDVLHGQKTGFYLDQRENRKLVRPFSNGCRVLDCFCNEGGFALNAAKGGALEVTGIDESESAIKAAEDNAKLNNLSNVCHFKVGNVFEELDKLLDAKQQCDLIVLDPPALTKSKKSIPSAIRAYEKLNTGALKLLAQGGVLATSSCSHHIGEETFLDIIFTSAHKSKRKIRMTDWRGASPDHPVLLAMPETRYLKFGLFVAD
jgi:23S rRNA (cytosine1962-C5)-methyltransferase